MSQSKKRLLLIAITFLVVLTAGPGACGSSDSSVEAAPEPTPWSKQDMMESAYGQGCTVFVFHGDDVGLAVCVGKESLAGLTESGKEYMFKFDSQETANLTLCQRNELGNYDTLQDISGVSPGDYLSWNSNLSLGWTRH